MKTVRDMFDIYAFSHQSDDQLLMLKDYVLDERLTKSDLNDKIMLDLGERYAYWNHTELMKTCIDNWFKTHEYNIKKLCDTVDVEYNPLYTKDYYEDFTSNKDTEKQNELSERENTSRNNTETIDSTNTGSETGNGTTSNSGTSTTIVDSTSEDLVSAYDSSTYQPQQKNETDSTTTVTTSDSGTTTDTKTTRDTIDTDKTLSEQKNRGRSETNQETENEDLVTQLHHYGKENDESYAALLQEERRLALFNIYDWIIEQLEKEICLGVY